jgi:hypothetical protein
MISTILRRLGFHCRHRLISRVFCERGRDGFTGRKYVVCMNCSERLLYDWDRMEVVEPLENSGPLVCCPVEEARRAL